jgi:hypothetical protein
MDRATLKRHLADAERDVALGEDYIARQRAIVARLEQAGQDSAHARRLLGDLIEIHQVHVADRDRLLEELARGD